MAVAWTPRLLTVEEYLEIERDSEVKHEYYAGRMYAMAGASAEHTIIASNITIVLGGQLQDKDCWVVQADLRLKVDPDGFYTYPDVLVVCGEARYTEENPPALLNPIAIVEVLSPTTEDYDRGKKFEFYRGLESLRDYVVVRQDRAFAEHHARQADGSWVLRDASGMEAAVEIGSIECRLALRDVYRKVNFKPSKPGLSREPVANPEAEPKLLGLSTD